VRRFAAYLLLGGGVALAQSALPPTSPTALTPASPVAPSPAVPPQPPAHHAQVVFAHGQLEITADDSSLNQILRDIGSQTGMKITGGVADQRVFGKYGPASPAEVLADLIDGTGSNMLLRDNAANVPAELILTPQGGGPTPPNPNARSFDDDTPDQPQPPARYEQEPPRPAYVAEPHPAAPAANTPDAASSSNPSSPGANPTSPNGVQTPQQIYEQLQRLQQTQAQPANSH
jgi:hypothetical protein